MNAGSISRAQARAAVYFGLAGALAEPSSRLTDELIAAADHGDRMLASTACHRAAVHLRILQPFVEADLAAQYRFVMTPPDRRPPALYESLHRHGRLMGDVTRAVEVRYRALGIESYDELPDHACVELAFLANLAAAETEIENIAGETHLVMRLRQEARQFLSRHAGMWLPELGRILAATGAPFYSVVGEWLHDFLVEERAGRRPVARVQTQVPTLRKPDACTLCGLCTGCCPHRALRIREDALHTRLTLVPARCTGCRRCVEICPEGTLELRTPSAPGGGSTLHQSPRLHCRGCHRPTVSQAEMAGVQTRLGPSGKEIESNLRYCPECKAQAQSR